MKNHFFLGAALAAFAIFVFWMGSYSYLLGPIYASYNKSRSTRYPGLRLLMD